MNNLNKLILYFLILLLIFSKEFLVINEEFLIILSFLTVFYGLKINLTPILVSELNDRLNQIKKQFLVLYDNKKQFQNILINILEKKLNLLSNFEQYNNILNNTLLKTIENKNVINEEYLNIYTNQLLLNYLLYYNLELKNTYLININNIASELYNDNQKI